MYKLILLAALLLLGSNVFYHRYFSHNSFKASRAIQFLGAVWATLSLQGGPLWWASQHLHHHAHADGKEDPHNPQHGWYRSQFNWFLDKKNRETRFSYVRKWLKYPELVMLNKYWYVPPALATVIIGPYYLIAAFIALMAIGLVTSLSHMWGTRAYETKDNSRNNFIIAMLTLGEGWHNNHHRHPWAANHGHAPWQIDITYLTILAMSKAGLVSNVTTYKEKK